MEEKIYTICAGLKVGEITVNEATDRLLILFNFSGRHFWLNKDDLEFAIALQQENRLEAVKWLCEKAKGHSITPLKDAKEILDAYR